MIVAVVGYKGGVGKTTVAMALAGAAGELVVDLDPQGSASDWSRMAQGEAPRVATVGARDPLERLGRELVIDTPPGDQRATRRALEAADVAVAPLRPSLADLRRLWPVLQEAEEAATPALAVLTMTRPRARSTEAVRMALAGQGVNVARAMIPLREAIAGAYGDKLPAELTELGRQLMTEVRRMQRR